MAQFEIDCTRTGQIALINFAGDLQPGRPEFRGFDCEHAAECKAADIACQLFSQVGYRPFEPRDAFEHFNS